MKEDKITKEDKKNQKLMGLIKKVHGLVENPDLEKQRQSQDQIGTIISNAKDVDFQEVDIDGMYGEWVTVNRSHMKKRVILHCHGGGYSTGSSLYARTLTTKLAEETLLSVFCFDYRLAPEHPYPAALEDALRAWDYLMSRGYSAENVIVTGDSAGGNLALALTLHLKAQGTEAHGRQLPGGLVLMSPWTDMTASGESYQTMAELDPVLDVKYMDDIVRAYAGNENLENPLISPLFADFTDFPPTYIQVGENEILFSDSFRLHKNLMDAGVRSDLDIFPGMWHVFQMSPVKAAKTAMDKVAEFIFETLGL